MADLHSPELKTRRRNDGRLDIVSRDVRGEEYVVRTTRGPEVTPDDVEACARGDRERTTPREFIRPFLESCEQRYRELERRLDDGLGEPSEMLARALGGLFWSPGFGPGEPRVEGRRRKYVYDALGRAILVSERYI